MTTWVAFLRGVNVGRAKRIAMADLRALCESLGFKNVRTVQNSGNVVFDSRIKDSGTLARRFEAALSARHGFHANTVFITLEMLERIVRNNPLGPPKSPSQFLVGIPYGATAMQFTGSLDQRDWSPDRFGRTGDAVYLEATTGLLESAMVIEFMRISKDMFTTRNWGTLQRVLDAAKAGLKP